MLLFRCKLVGLALGAVCVMALTIVRARGSDHADTPAIASTPGTDLTDVYAFPNPDDSSRIILIMDVHPIIPTGQGLNTAFDPSVLYQFKIDNSADNVEDLVIQAKFSGTNPATQTVQIAGPVRPGRTGTQSQFETPDQVTGTINQTFTLSNGIRVFSGARSDPFFFDLERFFEILPDRATPINGAPVPPNQANTPQATTWRAPGQAQDFLAGLNVLAIVIDLPKSQLIGAGNGQIGLWCTTSR